MDMQVTLQESKLLRREEVAAGTAAFHLEKPSGFRFKPGQAIDVEVGGDRHAFSIVSAPGERDLVIATRMRDTPYKRALAALPDGARIGIDGPFGSLTLHKDHRRGAVFIAGGIGITPFMSMLRQAARDDDDRPIALVYANRSPETAAYLEELQRIARTTSGVRLFTTTAIDAELLRNAARGINSPVHYVVGPPGMVATARRLLEAEGVADEDIRTEEFFGY